MGIKYILDKCPVCKTDCMAGYFDFKDKKAVECERCGKFKISITGLAASDIYKYKNGHAILSYYIKNLLQQDELLNKIKIDWILLNYQLPNYEQKYINLLNWIAKESDFSTKSVKGNSNNLASIIGSVDGKEVIEILDDIWGERLIEVEYPEDNLLRKFGPSLEFQIHLTPQGIKKIRGIDKGDNNSFMIKIKLTLSEWEYNKNIYLGKPGGFGEVYEGKDKNGKTVAVKKLKSNEIYLIGRELRIASELLNKNYENVLAYYDYGLDAGTNHYYLIMPKASKSLSEEIENKIKMNETAALKILLEILNGLKEIESLVHRDLKPANILLVDSKWKIADLGIAKFIEETTSINTLKECLSPPYAAPEQWNLLPSTKATDLYALGCIGFCLLTGKPPFVCWKHEEYKDKHLNSSPSKILGVSDRLNSILLMLLRKNPESRPTLDRTIEMFSKLIQKKDTKQESFNELEKVGAMEVEREAEEEALISKSRGEHKRKEKLLDESIQILINIKNELFQKIKDGAPSSKENIRNNSNYVSNHISLGDADLVFCIPQTKNIIENSKLERSGWDVLNITRIGIVQSHKHRGFVWTASLLYTDSGKNKSSYRWTELIFMTHPLIPNRKEYEPFALDSLKDIDGAIAPGMDKYQLASSPKFIDDEDIDSFCLRWLDLFVKAYKGELRTPNRLPLD